MMNSRLFHAVIAGGFALAAPIAIAACGGSESSVTGSTNAGDHEDASGSPTTSSSSGGDTTPSEHEDGAAHDDSGSDAMAHGDAHANMDAGDAGLHHDADVDADADAGWPPTK